MIDCCFIYIFLFLRQNCGWNQLTRTSSNGTTDGRCSLTESRFSINSSKNVHRRSNYRSPSANTSRTNKHFIQKQNSQSSIVYGYQSRH
jgi:hypothetical protein